MTLEMSRGARHEVGLVAGDLTHWTRPNGKPSDEDFLRGKPSGCSDPADMPLDGAYLLRREDALVIAQSWIAEYTRISKLKCEMGSDHNQEVTQCKY